jgi:hypothetical protein
MNIEPMSYEEIVAQISPVSNNSADHDVRFARAILAARDAQYAAMAGQEPVAGSAAWDNSEGWESLAWELCADENGEECCNELIWEGGPVPEPWGERWLKYEDEAAHQARSQARPRPNQSSHTGAGRNAHQTSRVGSSVARCA